MRCVSPGPLNTSLPEVAAFRTGTIRSVLAAEPTAQFAATIGGVFAAKPTTVGTYTIRGVLASEVTALGATAIGRVIASKFVFDRLRHSFPPIDREPTGSFLERRQKLF